MLFRNDQNHKNSTSNSMSSEQTAVAVLQPQPAATMGFESAPGFAHMQRVARMFSTSALVPDQFKGEDNLPNCVIALDMAKRLGANPLAVMQHLYIVHGKPGWSSQWIIGAINTCGRFEPLRFDITGTGDMKTCVAWTISKGIRLPDGVSTLAQAREYDVAIYESPGVSIGMAKAEGWYQKNGSKWKTMEDLMLRYRAATFFGRLYAPELLMGMKSVDELADTGETALGGPNTPPKQTLADASPLPSKRAMQPQLAETDAKLSKDAGIESEDEAREAEQGLAPLKQQPHAGPTLGESQQQLAEVVASVGCSFEQFKMWGQEQVGAGDSNTGPLAWDTFSGFGEVPSKAAAHFVKAKRSLITQLALLKGQPK